uniref:Transposase n=1 Tax=Ditylenchus dipsaci TaxID=166011 RepID=A0A915CVR7_9BILA
MAVAGPDYRFHFLSAKWPGSVNDARVLRNSAMAARFEQEGKASRAPSKESLTPVGQLRKGEASWSLSRCVIPGLTMRRMWMTGNS